MLNFRQQGAFRGVALVNRKLLVRDRGEIDALPDAATIALRIDVDQLHAADDQIGEYIDGFAGAIRAAFPNAGPIA